jgi:hypothetical protein
MKTLLSASLLAFMLCGPALADPPAAPAAPAAGDAPLHVHVVLKSAKHARSFTVATTAHSCAKAEAKEADREDFVHVCQTDETGKGVRLELDWTTREGAAEYRESSTVVLARGAKVELGSDDMRLTVQL